MMRLTVVTQNVKHGFWGSLDPEAPSDPGHDRLPAITERLAAAEPDLVVLNEIWRKYPVPLPAWSGAATEPDPNDPAAHQTCEDRIDVLADALGLTVAGQTPTKSGVPTAVLYREAALGRQIAWDTNHQHMFGHGAGVAVFQPHWLPTPLGVGAIHVSPWSWTHAMTEIHTLVCRIHERYEHGIIAGDLNFPPIAGTAADRVRMKPHNAMNRLARPWDPDSSDPNCEVAKELFKAGYLDTAVARFLETAAGGTPDASVYERTGKSDRIDVIAVSAGLADTIAGYRRLNQPAHGSDHHGVAAELDFARAAATADQARVKGVQERYRDYVLAVLGGADPLNPNAANANATAASRTAGTPIR